MWVCWEVYGNSGIEEKEDANMIVRRYDPELFCGIGKDTYKKLMEKEERGTL